MKKYINTLRSSIRYGKASSLLKKEKFHEAKLLVEFSLRLDTFSFMRLLHQALKGEIEYKLGHFDASRKTMYELREEFDADPKYWNSRVGQGVVERVNWFWTKLDEKTI